MDQIRIRQPKMPAAQSFIHNLGAFLTIKFKFVAANFSKYKKVSLTKK